MPRLFGTDGLRAKAGQFPLDEQSVLALGNSLSKLLSRKGLPVRIVIGRDTRESGNWLENCFCTGFLKGGGEAISAGIITTPGVSFLVRTHGYGAGVVISASHNPFEDNGIKIFSPQGTKVPEDWEEELEQDILGKGFPSCLIRETPTSPGESLKEDYLDFLRQVFTGQVRKKLKLVVDCANGASSELAPLLFHSLGFEVVTINNKPDGKNINNSCGSLHPERLAETVKKEKADLGIAFDGDADRAIWADEQGQLLNGDHTLFVQAVHMKEKNTLKKNTVVATIMSNMGLEKILKENGIKLYRTRVGDKYVLDEMIKNSFSLGGEQSGHTIFLDYSVAGDGLLTSLKMLEVMIERDQRMSELVRNFQEFPQILINVRVKEKIPLEEIPGYKEAAAEVEEKLGSDGRLEVRYSGTEPVARIMIEGPDQKQIKEMAERLGRVIDNHIGNNN